MKTEKTYIAPHAETCYLEPSMPLALSDTKTMKGAYDDNRTPEGPVITGEDNEDHPAKQSSFGSMEWEEF